ncbi:hypothetical protein FNB79_04700 [Formosa sediminum]|uniref:Uncharacterized protein n=1 Tax=Formosa sediminum TaxID=2594004 RepID=A0A516GPL4_9FLAO|nr:hypothetical protein [Formosa sediminum]QDO93300.1 hypothetical protein FNB79_04700 [Formosa sediminum]
MKKIKIILMCLCLWACNTEQKKETQISEIPMSALVLKDDILKIKYVEYGLDTKAKSDVESLKVFLELETIISELKSGDLSYFQGETKPIILMMKELKEDLPENIDSPSIQARLVSLETKMLKLQGLLKLQNISKAEQLQSVKEVLMAHSNLYLQINKKYEKDAQNIEKP